jgi:DNA polymerase (family 10)
MENPDIARIFADVADLLEIQGAIVFRVRAYRNAARVVETLPGSAASVLRDQGEKALVALPGIGKDLAGKIKEIVETGKLGLLEELKKQLPEGLLHMMHLPGIGPKRAKLVYETLGVKTLDGLEKAARSGRLQQIKGFGQTLQERILKGIADEKIRSARHRLAEAEAYVKPFVEHLRGVAGLKQIEVAGSFRRRQETVGDVDILVAAAKPRVVADAFVAYPDVKDVLARGDTRCSVVLRSGLQVDLRVVPSASYGAALYYFTGSKAHNIATRTIAVKKKLKVNEYGVFRGEKAIAGRTEAQVLKAIGLPWIPPELRENRGEIEAAQEKRLPTLVELKHIRGDLQMHTTYTDGKATLAEMVDACRRRGYEYIAITDHTKAVRVAGGLDRDEFRKQFREIELLQKTTSGITILKSAEVDILDEGRLDLDDDTLLELDVVVVSVHSKFNLTREQMTTRIVRALQHPRVHILGHPTGRIIGRREPYPVDMEVVVKTARDHGVMLEVNAQPDRLDLNDVHVQMAREAGVKVVISTDAHRIEELDTMRYGVDQARRGWCEPADVANTYLLEKFLKLLAR